ncbi:Sec-independent protein translocase protein TatB [Neptunomonas sp. XY-337]|uniref:Sec-independent protein translocase protein TatB n=1 Tax=Neptunomonas sp. XY-337 TaxID=2561897 RepID=UPI0010AABC97|nr:Sec-independent protein translocase protein TatB [Neptunomonas sp. XY-337]
MFDIGFAELLMIGVVALVVLGPEKLPTAVRTVGLWVGRAKRTISSVQSEISEELRMDELRRTAAIQKEELDKELAEMKQPFNSAFSEESPMAQSVDQVEKPQPADSPKVSQTTDSDSKSSNA